MHHMPSGRGSSYEVSSSSMPMLFRLTQIREEKKRRTTYDGEEEESEEEYTTEVRR